MKEATLCIKIKCVDLDPSAKKLNFRRKKNLFFLFIRFGEVCFWIEKTKEKICKTNATGLNFDDVSMIKINKL